MNVDDSMKKMTSSSAMSISEIRLISGSSFGRRVCIFMRARDAVGFAGLRLGAQRIGERHRDLFHVDDDAFHLAAQIAVGDERRNGDRQAARGGDQRFGDAAGEQARIAHAAEHDGVERADDAGDGAEQP